MNGFSDIRGLLSHKGTRAPSKVHGLFGQWSSALFIVTM